MNSSKTRTTTPGSRNQVFGLSHTGTESDTTDLGNILYPDPRGCGHLPWRIGSARSGVRTIPRTVQFENCGGNRASSPNAQDKQLAMGL